MNLLQFEIKRELKSTLIWALSISSVLITFLLFYPSFKKEADAFSMVLNNFPPEMLKGIGIDIVTLFSFSGFFSYVYTYFILAMGIYGLSSSLKIIGREKMNQSQDFLFVKPMSRQQIFINKVLAGLFLMSVLVLILSISLVLISLFLGEKLNSTLLQLFYSGCLIMIFFFCLGVILAVLFKRIKNPIAISSTIVLIFFVFMMMARVLDHQWMSYLTPFGLYDSGAILKGDSMVLYQLLIMLVGIVLLFLANILLNKKDIQSL